MLITMKNDLPFSTTWSSIIHNVIIIYSSVVYMLDPNNIFSIQQQISSFGAATLCSFERENQVYLMIGNQQDNIGNQLSFSQISDWIFFNMILTLSIAARQIVGGDMLLLEELKRNTSNISHSLDHYICSIWFETFIFRDSDHSLRENVSPFEIDTYSDPPSSYQ